MQNSSSAGLSRDISPEEYDVVILGGGTGGTIIRRWSKV
jgi:glycerol-3-phosphate dehydrogenase